MKTITALLFLILSAAASSAQTGITPLSPHFGYRQGVHEYRLQYMQTHEVVKGEDRKYFRFFKIDTQYYRIAEFKRIIDTTVFLMKTSGKKTPRYYKYGTVSFTIKNKPYSLTVYQGEDTRNTTEYKDYLFVPYTDLTSGEESYGGGKYIEFYINDIKEGKVAIDFNKAYNPYCAYTTGYNCPLPPRENHLNIAILAGEMAFGKQ